MTADVNVARSGLVEADAPSQQVGAGAARDYESQGILAAELLVKRLPDRFLGPGVGRAA